MATDALAPAGEPRVFRGIGAARGAWRIASLVVRYAGALAILHVLGLTVRGWAGWLLIQLPVAALIAARLWTWHRISVEVRGGMLRYEGEDPQRDFEIALADIHAIYLDRARQSRPLVLLLEEGERVCDPLSPSATSALHDHLIRAGVHGLDDPERERERLRRANSVKRVSSP